MSANSRIVATLDQGLILDTTFEDLTFTAYVVISEPDINAVAHIVPPEHYDQLGALHVAAVAEADSAQDEITDITFNMEPGDAAVLLCADHAAYSEVLTILGQHDAPPLLN